MFHRSSGWNTLIASFITVWHRKPTNHVLCLWTSLPNQISPWVYQWKNKQPSHGVVLPIALYENSGQAWLLQLSCGLFRLTVPHPAKRMIRILSCMTTEMGRLKRLPTSIPPQVPRLQMWYFQRHEIMFIIPCCSTPVITTDIKTQWWNYWSTSAAPLQLSQIDPREECCTYHFPPASVSD